MSYLMSKDARVKELLQMNKRIFPDIVKHPNLRSSIEQQGYNAYVNGGYDADKEFDKWNKITTTDKSVKETFVRGFKYARSTNAVKTI